MCSASGATAQHGKSLISVDHIARAFALARHKLSTGRFESGLSIAQHPKPGGLRIHAHWFSVAVRLVWAEPVRARGVDGSHTAHHQPFPFGAVHLGRVALLLLPVRVQSPGLGAQRMLAAFSPGQARWSPLPCAAPGRRLGRLARQLRAAPGCRHPVCRGARGAGRRGRLGRLLGASTSPRLLPPASCRFLGLRRCLALKSGDPVVGCVGDRSSSVSKITAYAVFE